MNISARSFAKQSLCQKAIASLPTQLQRQLSEVDLKVLLRTVQELEWESRELDHLPVFGYLSLRSDNFRELGKKNQEEVRVGTDLVEATLPHHGLDFILSTVFRGTPEHPGVVAGLSPRDGVETPGVLLKIPKRVKCLAAVLEREFFAECDLEDSNGHSNSMYLPFLKPVRLKNGSRVKALVFLTNPHSAKALSFRGKVVPERLAWHLAGEGGFRRKGESGPLRGGSCWSYWLNSYLRPRQREGQSVDPLVTEAMTLTRSLPEWPCAETASVDPKMLRNLTRLQKPKSEQAIERVRAEFDSGRSVGM